ncbi:MAG: PAS domain S-box protein [Bacteroidales bacterium]|nr:PAS domain S-box protein [Bacteroidales bacterium]
MNPILVHFWEVQSLDGMALIEFAKHNNELDFNLIDCNLAFRHILQINSNDHPSIGFKQYKKWLKSELTGLQFFLKEGYKSANVYEKEWFSIEEKQWYLAHVKVIVDSSFVITLKNITSIKKAYSELDLFFEANLDLQCIADTEGNFVKTNNAWAQLLGYSLEEINSSKCLDFVHPDDIEATLNAVKKLSDQEKVLNFINRYRTKAGDYRIIEWRSFPMGKMIYSVARDITHQKIAEEQLIRSEARFRSLFENNHAVMLIINPDDGQIVDANPSAASFYGYNRRQMQHMRINQINILSPEDIKSEMDAALKAERSQFFFKHRLANGTIRDVEVWSGKVELNNKEQLYSIIHDVTESNRIAEALGESEERYRSIYENSHDAMIILDPESLIFSNPNMAAIKLFGFESAKEFVGITPIQLSPEKQSDGQLSDYMARQFINEAIEKGGVFFEWVHMTRQGNEFTAEILLNAVPFKGKIMLQTTLRDITAVKNAQAKIVQSESRLMSLVSILQHESKNIQEFLDYSLNELISLTESKLGYIYFYDEAKQQFELNTWSKEVMKECEVAEPQTIYCLEKTGLWGEAVRQRKAIIDNDFQQSSPEKKGYPEGHVHLKRFLTIPVIHKGKIVAVAGVANKEKDYDNTDVLQMTLMMDAVWKAVEKLRAEESLRQSEAKYRIITENSSDVIWLYNMALKKFTFISPSILQLRGYTSEEAMKQEIEESVTKDDYPRIIASINADLPVFLEDRDVPGSRKVSVIQQPCKDGSLVWVEVITQFQFNNHNELEVLGVSRNINERVKMEQELRQNEARLHDLNYTKDKLFSIIAHDLRSPFTSFLGLSELMMSVEMKFSEQELREMALSLNKTAQSTYNLLENLLEWSRLQRGMLNPEPQFVMIRQLLNTTTETFQEQIQTKKLEVINQVEEKMVAYADEKMLESVMRNLLSNAIKFTPKGKRITLDAAKTASNRVRIIVTDTGIGIPDSILPNLFVVDELKSRKGTEGERSSGLGLMLCKEFVELNNGKIWVETAEKQGSSFFVELPRF